MSIARWLLVAALLACAASAARGLSAEAGTSASCAPAPAVPGVTEGRSLPATVAPSLGTVRAVLLLVHAADAPPDTSTAPPWDVIDAARAWFQRISYGRLELRVDTVPKWFALPARSAEYVGDGERYLTDVVAATDPYIDFREFDVVYIAPSSGTPETATSAVLNSFGVEADGRPIRLWIPFGAGFASAPSDPALLLHETGHLLGLPDLYATGVPASFHRWDLMAASWPAELLAWHRWKLGWLDASQVVCVTGRARREAKLTPLERPGGTKAVFVKRGNRVFAVEVRARAGYDRTMCESGVLVYEVDQTPFRRAPIRIHSAQSDADPHARGCPAKWNAPFDVASGERRRLQLDGLRIELLGKDSLGAYRVRVTSAR